MSYSHQYQESRRPLSHNQTRGRWLIAVRHGHYTHHVDGGSQYSSFHPFCDHHDAVCRLHKPPTRWLEDTGTSCVSDRYTCIVYVPVRHSTHYWSCLLSSRTWFHLTIGLSFALPISLARRGVSRQTSAGFDAQSTAGIQHFGSSKSSPIRSTETTPHMASVNSSTQPLTHGGVCW